MPDLTATVYPNEAYVLVQTDWAGEIYHNTFSVVSASNWPAADTGQTHTVVVGVAANFTTDGSQGLVTHAAVNTDRLITADVNMSDVDFSGFFVNSAIPTGDNLEVKMTARFVDTLNFVDARMFLNTIGTVTTNLRQRIAGVDTVSSTVIVPGVTNIGVYGWRLRAVGGTLYFRAWNATGPEPSTWNVTFATTMLSVGDIGVGSFIPPAVTTATPIIFYHDNLIAVDPNAVTSDCAIVTRRNTVTGEMVNLRPYIFYNADGALILECGQGLWWDTEPPLNVPIEYCTLACDADVTVTANPDFETSAGSWTATGGVLTQDCTVAKVGTCSGLLTPGGTVTNPNIAQTTPALAAGRLVTMSAWAMSPQGWNSVLLRLVVTYADLSSETLETDLVTLDDNEWRYLSLSFTPGQPILSAVFSFIAAGLPPNTTLFHIDEIRVAQATEVAATDCETVTVASESVWLKSPLHPCDDVEIGLCDPMLMDCEETARVSYVGTFDDNYAPNTVLLSPVNRQFPLPINRIRRAPTATLRLLAHDCDARDAVLQANEPGSPLLFQAPADYCIPDRYISVGALEETRISVDQREDFRLMTLPYATVQRPEGPMDGPCGARIQDLCDIYSSWAALSMAGLTWTDLLLGEASPNGPGQPAPPANARTWGEVETEFASWLAVEAGGTRDWGELRDGL